MLRRPAAELLDAPLHVALGISPERARELDARAREDRRAVEFVSARFGPKAKALEEAAKQPLADGSPFRPEEPSPLRLVLCMQEGEPMVVIQDLDALLDGAPPVQISKLSLVAQPRDPQPALAR